MTSTQFSKVDINDLPIATQDVVKLVTDPYHDFALQIVKVPDGRFVNSYLRYIKPRMTLSNPFSATWNDGDTWTVRIVTTPVIPGGQDDARRHWTSSSSSNGVIIDGGQWQVSHFMFFFEHIRGGVAIASQYKSLPREALFHAGSHSRTSPTVTAVETPRILSSGFEVHDITADLSKQGSVTVFRIPYSGHDVLLRSGTATWSSTLLTSYPLNVDQANQLHDARTFSSKEGVYAVSLPAFPLNPINASDSPIHIGIGDPISLDEMLLSSTIVSQRVNTTSGDEREPVVSSVTTALSAASPLHCACAYFEGLGTSTVLSFDARVVIEVSCSVWSPNLNLCTPAPRFDPSVVKLLRQMSMYLDPGVPVRFNDAGTWFKRVLSVVRTVAPAVLPLLPLPKVVTSIATQLLNKGNQSNNNKSVTNAQAPPPQAGRFLTAKQEKKLNSSSVQTRRPRRNRGRMTQL